MQLTINTDGGQTTIEIAEQDAGGTVTRTGDERADSSVHTAPLDESTATDAGGPPMHMLRPVEAEGRSSEPSAPGERGGDATGPEPIEARSAGGFVGPSLE